MPRELRHVGLNPTRQNGTFPQAVRERAFAERWAEENDRGAGNMLELLLMGLDDRGPMAVEGPHGRIPRPPRLTQRDATIAATLIQWLGTNVGFEFVCQSLATAGMTVRPQTEDNARTRIRIDGRLGDADDDDPFGLESGPADPPEDFNDNGWDDDEEEDEDDWDDDPF